MTVISSYSNCGFFCFKAQAMPQLAKLDSPELQLASLESRPTLERKPLAIHLLIEQQIALLQMVVQRRR